MRTQRDKTPDQIAQEVIDRTGEWLEIEAVYGPLHDEEFGPEYSLDGRQLKLIIIELIERERGTR